MTWNSKREPLRPGLYGEHVIQSQPAVVNPWRGDDPVAEHDRADGHGAQEIDVAVA